MPLVAIAILGMVHRETFAGAPKASLGEDAKYTDVDGYSCAHKLHESSDPTQRSVDSQDSDIPTEDPMDPDGPHVEAGPILGYDAFYVDTLGTDGSAALHTDGAAIGVVGGVQGTDDGFAFELNASGMDGMTIVCSHPFTPKPPRPLVASARGKPLRASRTPRIDSQSMHQRPLVLLGRVPPLTHPASTSLWDSVRQPQGLARGCRRVARLG